MWEEPTEERCDVCGQHKEPTEIQIRSSEPSTNKTALDRVRAVFRGTDDSSGTTNEKESSATEKSETFYLCPDRSCESREDDIREMERWRLKNDPGSEFTEEKLDEVVAESVSKGKRYDRITKEAMDDVYSRMVEDSDKNVDENDTETNDA